jgi:GTP-binding protein HflX
VLDASDPAFRDQYEVTREVLSDICEADHPRLLILNKSDLLDEESRQALREEFRDAIVMSAASKEDVDALYGRIQDFFERSMEEADFVIPYDQQGKVALLHERCRVLTERYEEDGAHVRVRAPGSTLSALRREL